jgi:hypothetical protein
MMTAGPIEGFQARVSFVPLAPDTRTGIGNRTRAKRSAAAGAKPRDGRHQRDSVRRRTLRPAKRFATLSVAQRWLAARVGGSFALGIKGSHWWCAGSAGV